MPFYSALVSYEKNTTDGNIGSYKNNLKKYTKNIATQSKTKNFTKFFKILWQYQEIKTTFSKNHDKIKTILKSRAGGGRMRGWGGGVGGGVDALLLLAHFALLAAQKRSKNETVLVN